jgi:polar amino acid transport system substrate-binding protein
MAWSAEAMSDRIDIAFYDRPPIHFMRDAQAQGILVDRMNAIAARAAVAPTYLLMPANRITKEIEEGVRPVCALGWFVTEERTRFAWFSPPISRSSGSVLIVRRGDANRFAAYDHVATLFIDPQLRFAYDGSGSYGAVLDGLIRNATLLKHRMIAEAERFPLLVATGRVDFVISSRDYLRDDLDSLGLTTLAMPGLAEGLSRHLMCSRAVPGELLRRIEAAIAGIGATEHRIGTSGQSALPAISPMRRRLRHRAPAASRRPVWPTCARRGQSPRSRVPASAT